MDRHILWLRRHIVHTVVRRTMRLFLAVFVSGCVVALVRGGLRIDASGSLDRDLFGVSANGRFGSEPLGLVDVVMAFLAAQLVAGGRLLLAIEANPLNRRYLRHYGERPLRFRPIELTEDWHEAADPLPEYGLTRLAAIGDLDGDASTVFDLFRSDNRLVVAAVARNTGSLTVLSELDDGRLVVSTTTVALPNERLVVNLVPSGSVPQLLASHRALLDSLIGRRATPVPSSPEAFVRSLQIEKQSYQALGPVVGSFCDLLGSRRNPRLMVRLDAESLRSLSFADGSAGLPPLRIVPFEAVAEQVSMPVAGRSSA